LAWRGFPVDIYSLGQTAPDRKSCRHSARKGLITGMRAPRIPATQHGIVGNSFPMDILIGRLFSLLVVPEPDMQAFTRVPDSDYPPPLGSWCPAAGCPPSRGLGSVQGMGQICAQDGITRPLLCEDSADQSAVDRFNVRAAVQASRFLRDELSTWHCINMKGFRKMVCAAVPPGNDRHACTSLISPLPKVPIQPVFKIVKLHKPLCIGFQGWHRRGRITLPCRSMGLTHSKL
jgi:hypothetical protein